MAKLGISCLENAVLITLLDANHQDQTSLKESEIRKRIGINEVYSSDRIIFSILDNLKNKQIVENLGDTKWQIRKTEGSK